MTSEHDSRLKFLRLLGFSKDELQKKVSLSRLKHACCREQITPLAETAPGHLAIIHHRCVFYFLELAFSPEKLVKNLGECSGWGTGEGQRLVGACPERVAFVRLSSQVDAYLKKDLKLGGSPSQLEAVDLKSDRTHAFCHKVW